MNTKKNTVVTPQRTTWRDLIGELEVGQFLQIPAAKCNSVGNIISERFHANTKKRFTVTYKDQPEGLAKVTRLKDAE